MGLVGSLDVEREGMDRPRHLLGERIHDHAMTLDQ
jgi:hypothetical protein